MANLACSGTRQLWILRHAKAADALPGGRDRDRDRPLGDRGRRDATALGRRMAGDNVLLDIPELVRPDVAMSSAAVRAVQTAELVLGQLTDRVPLGTYNSLYEAEPETVETYIREVEEHARSVLIIGHNPTLYRLTWDLLTDGSPDRDLLAHRGFPTCALAVVEFRVDGWDDVSDGQGSLLGLLAPPW